MIRHGTKLYPNTARDKVSTMANPVVVDADAVDPVVQPQPKKRKAVQKETKDGQN